MLLTIFIICFGLFLLTITANILLNASTNIAYFCKIPPFLIGLLVIALGTSAPEIFITVVGAMQAKQNLIFGNIIGSNIANLGLVLGLSFILTGVTIKINHHIKLYLLFLLLSALLLLLSAANLISFIYTGILVFCLFFGFLFLSYSEDFKDNFIVGTTNGTLTWNICKAILCLLLLAVISDIIIQKASNLAMFLGFSEFTIGLTIVAIGTSLPELVTSLVAGFNRQYNLLLGTIIGSNIANSTIVLGINSFLSTSITNSAWPDALIALGFTIYTCICISVFKKIHFLHGIILVLAYIAYLWYLFLYQ